MGVPSLRVAVVGGSIGGLTAALLLRDLGCDVRVLERSSAPLEQRGAGIGFLEAAGRYLARHADTAAIATGTRAIRYLRRDGSIERELPVAYRFTSWNALYRGLLALLEPARYELGREVTAFAQHDEVVRLTVGAESREVDLAVFADGVASPARRVLLPGVEPAYAGYIAWRGMVAESDLPTRTVAALDDAITYHVYANSHILLYPIPGPNGGVARGERTWNVVWYRNYAPGADLDDLMTDVDGVRRDLSLPPGSVRAVHVAEARAHARARLPAPIAEVVERCAAPFCQVVFDLDVPRMAFGRVCLLGDAAHVARPHAAAGTAKASENGWALADALRTAGGDVRAALGAWEVSQLALGAALVARTRAVGRRSQFDGTWDPADRDLIFGLAEPGR